MRGCIIVLHASFEVMIAKYVCLVYIFVYERCAYTYLHTCIHTQQVDAPPARSSSPEVQAYRQKLFTLPTDWKDFDQVQYVCFHLCLCVFVSVCVHNMPSVTWYIRVLAFVCVRLSVCVHNMPSVPRDWKDFDIVQFLRVCVCVCVCVHVCMYGMPSLLKAMSWYQVCSTCLHMFLPTHFILSSTQIEDVTRLSYMHTCIYTYIHTQIGCTQGLLRTHRRRDSAYTKHVNARGACLPCHVCTPSPIGVQGIRCTDHSARGERTNISICMCVCAICAICPHSLAHWCPRSSLRSSQRQR
jgi:hypothetical protein